MKIGILGSGDVAKAIATGFLNLNDQVKLSSRDSTNKELQEWVKQQGGNCSSGSFAEAAEFGEVIVIAVAGKVVEEVINAAGKEKFSSKIVMDITNPIDTSQGMPPKLIAKDGSNGEFIQKLLPEANVVKTLNISGNDQQAKQKVSEILQSFGWANITDLGGIEQSRIMESLCILWVIYGMKHNNWHIGFKMLQK